MQPLTGYTIWKWNTPEEANAFLQGVEWVNDSALTATKKNPLEVLIHDKDNDSEELIVRYGGGD